MMLAAFDAVLMSNSDAPIGAEQHIQILGALILAGITAIITNGILFYTNSKWGEMLVARLIGTRRALQAFKWVVGVALVLMLAAIIDFLGFRALLYGSATIVDILLVPALVVLGSIYAWGLWFEWRAEGSALEMVETALTDAKAAEEVRLRETKKRRTQHSHWREIQVILSSKWKRLNNALNGDPAPQSLIENAIDSEAQVAQLIAAIHRFVRADFRDGLTEECQLRVAYFEPVGESLRVIASFDGTHAECIKTPNGQHAERFLLESTARTKCLAVFASWHGNTGPIMITDADTANMDPHLPYEHFSDSQKESIKSIAALACRRGDDEAAPHAVLTLDTNRLGHFGQQSGQDLRSIVDPFALQILFERDVDRLATKLLETLRGSQPNQDVEDTSDDTMADRREAKAGT